MTIANAVNRTAGVGARNGTTSHTITFPAAQAGSLLVAVVAGAVTHTWPGGWTERLQPVNFTELSVATRTAAGGETSVTVTHNAANYPIQYVIYELAAGSTWVAGTSASNTATWPTLTGLPGTAVTVVGVQCRSVSVGLPTAAATWVTPWVEDYDNHLIHDGVTDGIYMTVGYLPSTTATSATPNGDTTLGNTERVVFAVTVSAGGGATNLTVAGATQAQTSGQVTLSQVHGLTVAGATQAQTAGQVTLSQVHGLTVAGATQTQIAGQVTLAQVHHLAVDPAAQDQISDNVTLAQMHVLTVDGAAQAQIADGVTLSVGGISLAVADAVQAQTAENVTLTIGPGAEMPLNTYELPLAELLLDCLTTAVTVDHPNPPQHFSLRVGTEVAQDMSEYQDLCCEGLAYVKINSVYPSTNFPEPDEQYTPCAGRWAAELEMGVLRCAPTGSLEYIPTDAEWTEAARQVAHDSMAMRQAMACFRDGLEMGTEWIPRPWGPIPTEGGCTGGAQVVTVGFIYSYC